MQSKLLLKFLKLEKLNRLCDKNILLRVATRGNQILLNLKTTISLWKITKKIVLNEG